MLWWINLSSCILGTGAVTNDTVIQRQNNTLNVLNEVGGAVLETLGWIRMMHIIVSETNDAINENKSLSYILTNIDSFLYTLPQYVQRHHELLSLSTILCVAANLQLSRDTYRTFSLDSIRDECGKNNDFIDNKYIFYHKRMAIKLLIKEYIDDTTNDESMVKIYRKLNNFMTSDPLLTVLDTPDGDDLICEISMLYPNKTVYDYYDLYHDKCMKNYRPAFVEKLQASDNNPNSGIGQQPWILSLVLIPLIVLVSL